MSEATVATKQKPEIEVVKMQDGREVGFAGKRKLNKDTLIEGSSVKIRLDFRNGETRTYDISGSKHFLQFAGHGAEQKYGDELAGLKGQDGGEPDLDDMVMAVDDLHDRLQTGEWTMKREGGTGTAGASVLVKALVEVTGKTIEEVKAFLKAQVEAGTSYQKLNAAFSEDATVGPVIKRLNAAKASKGPAVDTKAVLAGLR